MRKTILVLMLLVFAADAWADLAVTCTSAGSTVTVSYSGAHGDPNRPRAFALDVSLSGGATISNAATTKSADFYIYPGSIVIDANNGAVTSWGTPVAAGGNGSSTMTIEMASLYATNDPVHKSPPPASGTLFTFDVSGSTTVIITKNAARGGVVKENGNPDLTDSVCTCIPGVAPPSLTGTVTLMNLTSGREVGKRLQIKVYDVNTSNLVETLTTDLGSGGTYDVDCAVADEGTYDLCYSIVANDDPNANTPHWLSKKVAAVTLSPPFPVTVNVSLTNGDVDGSDAITSADLGGLKVNYLKCSTTPYLPGDLNEDGCVTSTDLGILKISYLMAGSGCE